MRRKSTPVLRPTRPRLANIRAAARWLADTLADDPGLSTAIVDEQIRLMREMAVEMKAQRNQLRLLSTIFSD